MSTLGNILGLRKFFERKLRFLWDDKDRCGLSPIRTGPWDPFTPACRVHDKLYEKRAGTRELADERFFQDVDRIVKNAPWYLKPILKPWGSLYKYLVKRYGKRAWDT